MYREKSKQKVVESNRKVELNKSSISDSRGVLGLWYDLD